MLANVTASRTHHLPGSIRGERGFTLIEVMIASTLFMVLFSAIMGLQVLSTRLSQNARNYEKASKLLLDMSEYFQVLPPQKLQNLVDRSSGQAFTKAGILTQNSSLDAYYTLKTVLIPDSGTFKQLALTVYWMDPGVVTQRSVTSNMLVALP